MRSALHRHWLVLVLPLVLLFSGAVPASADNPAVDFTAYGRVSSNNDWCLGWEFDVLSPVEVTALGVFDGTGLSPSGHAVGVWDSLGNLLASTTVFSSDSLVGAFFRFKDLDSPLTLPVGVGYCVAAVYPHYYNYGYSFGVPEGWTVDPRISFVWSRSTVSTTLQYPDGASGLQYGLFGGNLMLKGDPVPEPTLIQLPFLLGLGSVGAWWRRRKTT